jgi:hypothetical protein
MPRTDGRIEKGQSLKTAISARAWNRAQDAADIVLGVSQSITVDGLQLPMIPQVVVYARMDGVQPAPLVGEPFYLAAGSLSATQITPYTTEAPTEVERRMFGTWGWTHLMTASRSFATSPVRGMVGVCVDPLKKAFCVRGVVPVRVMSPTKTADASLAGSLRQAVIYPTSFNERSFARLVSAGGFQVFPLTPLPAAGSQASLPTVGWGMAML